MADSSGIKDRVILFGSGGMTGSALAKAISGPNLYAFQHKELDITDYVAVEKVFVKYKPQVVINAAAFTRVDDCEKFRETAFLVNTQAPDHIAEMCKRYGSNLVHYSTDYIFDGTSNRPYPEDHPARPINYYGTTKWEAEKRIVSSGCSFLILRTSWIFGRNGDNFVKKIVKRALAGARLQAPVDQIGIPTYADDVAAATLRLLSLEARGVYHFGSSGHCSRFEQAQMILKLYGLNNSLEAAKNEDLNTPARRPHFSVLDISLYIGKVGQTPRSWEQSTAEYIAFLKQSEQELRS